LEERFTFANQRFCAMLGKPLEEIIGKTDFDFYPPSWPPSTSAMTAT